MRLSLKKKIVGLVSIPIVFICLLVGIVTSNIMRILIVEEIELQLKTASYGISKILEHVTTVDELGDDLTSMRTYTGIDLTVFEGNKRIASTIENAVGTEMDSEILKHLQDGNDYFLSDAKVNGTEYFGYYIPFFENGKYTSAVFAGLPTTEVEHTILVTVVKIIVCLVGCGLIFVIIALLFVGKLLKSVSNLENTVGTLLSNDLATQHTKYAVEHDEMESLSNKVIDFSSKLKFIMIKIKEFAEYLGNITTELEASTSFTNDTCGQISQAVESVASGAVSQAEETSDASSKISDMSSELSKIKDNANDLNVIAESMNVAKNNALASLVELQRVNEGMIKDINSTSNQVNETNESVTQITKVVGLIQDIANQTKLLSLNASIEAARAGENGRGFAVVAEEIGKLASQSSESSDEISKILKQLVNNYSEIIVNVDNTTNNMKVQSDKLCETQEVFNILEKDINTTIDKIDSINSMVENINKEISSMVGVLTSLTDISEENSASTEETMAGIQELNAAINQIYEKVQIVGSSASSLLNEVSIFKTE